MTKDQITIIIDSAESTLPRLNADIRCPKHPETHSEYGFGLAGGGYGTYTMCPKCGSILSKDQEEYRA